MRVRLFMVAVALFVALFQALSWSVQNPWIGNPIGSSTVPQSSISSGLVNTPDPIDTTGNLLITGNVRRGMHFRGNVPYQSPTSFGSTLGSSALSSFLRDTAGPEDFGSYAQRSGPQPYYSATETVTTMTPGRSEVLSPMSARTNTRVQQDARSEWSTFLGPDASQAEPMSFGRGTAEQVGLQGSRTQYHLYEESRLTAEGRLSGGTLSSPRSAERSSPGWVGTGREGQLSAIERFQDRGQGPGAASRTQTTTADSALGLGYDSAVSSGERQQRWAAPDASLQYPSPATGIESPRSRFETQVQAQPGTDVKQPVAAGYGFSGFDELAPSTSTTMREGSGLQKDTSWAGTSQKLSGRYGDSLRNEIANVERGAPYASVSSGGPSAGGLTDQNQRDVLERIRRQLEDLTRSVEAGLQNVPGEPAQTAKTSALTKPETFRSGGQGYVSDLAGASSQRQIDSSSASSLYTPQRGVSGLGGQAVPAIAGESQEYRGVGFLGPAGLAPARNETSALDQFEQLSQTDVAAEAKRIKGPHASLESLSSAKFNEHLLAAQEHLRAGLYYRAADSFALASVYRPDDPFVLAGQSHALFAAGEYMSSALFLSRALALYPEYMQMRVDLAGLLGGQERVARRLADVEQWYARSGSGQLQLLLGYVYYRTGNLTQAKRAVDAAYEKMPELPAARAMKIAIDAATR